MQAIIIRTVISSFINSLPDWKIIFGDKSKKSINTLANLAFNRFLLIGAPHLTAQSIYELIIGQQISDFNILLQKIYTPLLIGLGILLYLLAQSLYSKFQNQKLEEKFFNRMITQGKSSKIEYPSKKDEEIGEKLQQRITAPILTSMIYLSLTILIGLPVVIYLYFFSPLSQ